MKKKIVFLDRDGTLIEEIDFLSTVEETRLFPFTVEALRLFKDAGFEFAVTTNQSGIARGYFDDQAVEAIHRRIEELLEEEGVGIKSYQYCPHLPDAGCPCRKPSIGMIEQASEGHEVDLENSWVIGDKILDVTMGFNAGTKTALVLTGYGAEHQNELTRKPTIIAENLLEAARMITGENG
jgi:D-glycero-D-manno-heptose 1,7-bisphosphate phosphatase